MRAVYLIVFILTASISSRAQLLKGTVMDAKTDVPVSGATIFNLSQHIYKKASYTGQYSIIAMAGDSIVYSSAGYRADTIRASEELLRSGMDIGLQSMPVTMDTVTIRRDSYAEDSIRRRNDYAHFYKLRQPGILSGERPATGFGLSLSPFTYFSKEAKARRRFKKQLQHIEEQAYIDYYFSPSYVHRVTGLTGERLYLFMRKYRPSYSFARQASAADLLSYINNCLKNFKK